MGSIELSVLVETAYLDRYIEVVEACRRAGMRVERQMAVIGVITGTIEISRVHRLQKIAGVRGIEPSHTNRSMRPPNRN